MHDGNTASRSTILARSTAWLAAAILLAGSAVSFAAGKQSIEDKPRSTDAMSNELKAEMKIFGQKWPQKGNLLTPARGTLREDVRMSRSLINDLIETLAGPQLRAAGAHVVVNIYGNSVPNAWVQGFNPNDQTTQEGTWLAKHPGVPWPLREAWTFAADGKPIYEVGVTTGLLRMMSTVDQLSFVFGHELTHLLEGHTDSSDENFGKIWWQKQAHEVVADHLGIDKMLGRFNLSAAIEVLAKLHPKRTKREPVEEALQDAIAEHHSEGARIAAAQAYVEYLKRYDERGTPRAEKKLPLQTRLRDSVSRTTDLHVGSDKPRESYFALLDQWIDGKQPAGVDVFLNRRESPTQRIDDYYGVIGHPDEEGFAKLILETAEHVGRSKADRKTKLNSFVRSMIFLGSRLYFEPATNWLEGLTSQQRFSIARFLVENAAGPGGWQSEDLRVELAKYPPEARMILTGIFYGSRDGQELTKKLMHASPNWQKVFQYWQSSEAYLRDGIYSGDLLADDIRFLGKDAAPASPLRDKFRESVAQVFSGINDSREIVSEVSFTGATSFARVADAVKWERKKEKLPWTDQISSALAPHQAVAQTTLVSQVVDGLKSPQKTEGDVSLLLTNLLGIRIGDLSRPQKTDLLTAYGEYIVRRFEKRTGSEGEFPPSYLSQIETEMVAVLLKGANGDRLKEDLYIKHLLTSMTPELFNTLNPSLRVKRVFREYLSSIDVRRFFEVLQSTGEEERRVANEISQISNAFKARDIQSLLSKISDHALSDSEKTALRAKVLSWSRLSGSNYRLAVNFLQFVTIGSEGQSTVLNQMSLLDFKKLLTSIEYGRHIFRFSLSGRTERTFPQAASKNILQIYLNVQAAALPEDRIKLYDRMAELCGATLSPTLKERRQLSDILQGDLNQLSFQNREKWLQRSAIKTAVGATYVGTSLAAIVAERVGKTDTSSRRSRISIEIAAVEKIFKLRESWPDAFTVFRNTVAENLNVQPAEASLFFPGDKRTTTEKVEEGGTLIRAMSAFSSFARALKFQDQLQLIEFIMSRTENIPAPVERAMADLAKERIDLKPGIFKLRQELQLRTVMERTMVVNSVLTGPNGMAWSSSGLPVLKRHLLKAVSSKNQDIGNILLDSLSRSEGKARSIVFSYALAQKRDGLAAEARSEEQLTEAEVLKALLDFRGVPGVKLAQYLAFTNDFKNFRGAFESYQDAAMPISYFDAIQLISERLGEAWDPMRFRVVRILGSGSVNITIEYEDLTTGRLEAVSIAREKIETKTKEDFRTFRIFLKDLVRNAVSPDRFEFLVGLVDFIEESVALEFDKKHSFEMQKKVRPLYNQSVDGWEIQSVDAYAVEGMAIRMQKAVGLSARKVLEKDPKVYRSAMKAFLTVEDLVLMGVSQNKNWIPVSLHANPDIHDGQIIIDVSKKRISVLDFGQAVEISNIEREFGVDLLRIISGAESVESAHSLILKNAIQFVKTPIAINHKSLAAVLKRGDRMDVFVHLASFLSRAGFKIPLPTVHWIFAINRRVKLAEKIGESPETALTWLIRFRKLGLPIAAYNGAHDLVNRATDRSERDSAQPQPSKNRCELLFQ